MKYYLIILSLLYLFVPCIDAVPQQSGSLSKVLNKKSKKDTLLKPKSGTLKNIMKKNATNQKSSSLKNKLKQKNNPKTTKPIQSASKESEETNTLYIIIGALALIVIVLMMRKGGKGSENNIPITDNDAEMLATEEEVDPTNENGKVQSPVEEESIEEVNKDDWYKTEIGYYNVSNVDGPKVAILNKNCPVLNLEGIKNFYLINGHSATLSPEAFYLAMAMGYDLSNKKAVKNLIANHSENILKTYDEITSKMEGDSFWEAFINELLKIIPEDKLKEAEQFKKDFELAEKQGYIDAFNKNREISREKDEFENKERVTAILPTLRPDSSKDGLDYFIWSLVCDMKDGKQLFAFHLLVGAQDWYFFKEEDGLAFITDSTGTMKLSSLKPDRQTKNGGGVQEYLIYPITLEQIHAIVQTKNKVKYRLQYNEGRQHLDDEFIGLQLYLSDLLNELGIKSSLPKESYLKISTNDHEESNQVEQDKDNSGIAETQPRGENEVASSNPEGEENSSEADKEDVVDSDV